MFDFLPASYTETVSELIYDILIENGVYTPESILNVSIEDRVEAAAPYIFEDYPIFDEDYRETLNSLILCHYFTREIGAETPDLFLFYLNRELREIMPYYNKLYLSETLSYNPLYTVDRTVEHKGTGTKSDRQAQDSTGTTSRSKAENVASDGLGGFTDTPQGAVTGLQSALTPGGSGYLTNAQMQKGTQRTTGTDADRSVSHASGTASSSSVDSYIDHVTGYEGKPAEMIQEYRKTLLNINVDILKKLSTLFMGMF